MDADAKTDVVFDADFPRLPIAGWTAKWIKTFTSYSQLQYRKLRRTRRFQLPATSCCPRRTATAIPAYPNSFPVAMTATAIPTYPNSFPVAIYSCRRNQIVTAIPTCRNSSPVAMSWASIAKTSTPIYTRGGANRPIGDGDLGMLLRLEELIVSFREKKDCGRQSASSKNDRKPTATAFWRYSREEVHHYIEIRYHSQETGRKRKEKLESNSATPQVSIDSTSAAVQDRADKVFTMGTECNAIIAWVAKHKNVNAPAYTRPFYQRLKDDAPLRTNCKISLLALRRSPTSGSTFWSTSQWNRDQTREYTLNWQLYIRYLEAHEPNTSEFRMAWGKSLTEILNRFGAGYPIPQKNRYEGSWERSIRGLLHALYHVQTYRRNVFLRFSNEDIAEDTDLLNLYFGENERGRRACTRLVQDEVRFEHPGRSGPSCRGGRLDRYCKEHILTTNNVPRQMLQRLQEEIVLAH